MVDTLYKSLVRHFVRNLRKLKNHCEAEESNDRIRKLEGLLVTSSVELLGKYAGRGNDLLEIMRLGREWLGQTGHWQRAENGACICGRLIKSSGRSVSAGSDSRVEALFGDELREENGRRSRRDQW